MAGDSHYWVAGEEALCRAERMCRVVSFTCASWWLIPLRVGDVGSTGWLGFQSRARSGWVFSFSPLSSCFRVPASTTDWDLIIGEGKRCDYRQFMVWAILESWRAFRLHGSLIKQDTQLYNFSPLCISVFLAFVSSTSRCRDLLLIKQTHVLATILPLCLSILWILRCIKSHKFGWIFNVSKYFWEPLFLKVIGNYHIWC